MNWRILLRRNLRFHRRGNLAVILGIAVGTAALVGALLVGESLRGSLRERVERRLGGMESILTAHHPVTLETATVLHNRFGLLPLTIARGSIALVGTNGQPQRRVNEVTVIRGYFEWPDRLGYSYFLDERQPVSLALAAELGIRDTSKVILRMQTDAGIPRETAFGNKSSTDRRREHELKVRVMDPADPRNEFNPLALNGPNRSVLLDSRWGIKTYHNTLNFNTLLAQNYSPTSEELRQVLGLPDYGLRCTTLGNPTSIQLLNDSLFLPRLGVEAAIRAPRNRPTSAPNPRSFISRTRSPMARMRFRTPSSRLSIRRRPRRSGRFLIRKNRRWLMTKSCSPIGASRR